MYPQTNKQFIVFKIYSVLISDLSQKAFKYFSHFECLRWQHNSVLSVGCPDLPHSVHEILRLCLEKLR